MGRGTGISINAASALAPGLAPPAVSGGGGLDREDHWRSSDSSVTAVSFGFVATAILISMFLFMAIFERFLQPRSPESAFGGDRSPNGGEENMRKLDDTSPKNSVYPRGISVLMPGERVPTFLAHPAPTPTPSPSPSPLPCPHESSQLSI